MIAITPPLEKSEKSLTFTMEDVIRSYRLSLIWPENYFSYKPKFLLEHFKKFFNVNGENHNTVD